MTGHRSMGFAAVFAAALLAGCNDLPGPVEPLQSPPGSARLRPSGGPPVLLPERLIAPGSFPDISGARVAYECGQDICVHDLASGLSQQLTFGGGVQQGPVIDGDRVIYRDQQRGLMVGLPGVGLVTVEDLTLFDLITNTQQILVPYSGPTFPSPRVWVGGPPDPGPQYELSGEYLAYESRSPVNPGLLDITLLHVSFRTFAQIDGSLAGSIFHLHDPTVSQEYLAFWGATPFCNIAAVRVPGLPLQPGGPYALPLSAVIDARIGIQYCPAPENEPAIADGGLLALTRNQTGNGDVVYQRLPQALGIAGHAANGPARESNPHVWGDRIVWQDARNGNLDIYMLDLSTGVETRITSDLTDDHNPRIDGDRIVWQRGGWPYNGVAHVYVREFNHPPVAAITSPTDGDAFVEGEGISFQGSGIDPEEGALGGASLQWNSDVSGSIGVGTSFVRSDLPLGSHLITLEATDAHGSSSTASVQIEIQAAPEPPGPEPPSSIGEWLDLLEAQVLALQAAGRLDEGGADKLLHRIRKAREALAQGKEWKVVLELELFLDRVDKLVRAGELDPAGAAELEATATAAIAAAGS